MNASLLGNSGSLNRWPMTASTPEYRTAVNRVLASGILTEGPEVDALEEEFSRWLNPAPPESPPYVVALNSGTAAISAALLAAGLKTGARVLMPALSFTATALAATNVGMVPVFCDVDETWSIDREQALRAAPYVDAIIGVDLHGMPADWDALRTIAEYHRIPLIEDACPAYGATYDGVRCGLLGPDAAFSLNQSKILPAGEGGLYVTENYQHASLVRSLRRFGEVRASGHRYSAHRGYNWKLPELSAAIARAGLPALEDRAVRSFQNGRIMEDALLGSDLFSAPVYTQLATPVWHKYRVRVTAGSREDAEAVLVRAGIPHAPIDVMPLSMQPAFGRIRTFPNAFEAVNGTVVLGTRERPIFAWTKEEVTRIHDGLRDLQGVNV